MREEFKEQSTIVQRKSSKKIQESQVEHESEKLTQVSLVNDDRNENIASHCPLNQQIIDRT